MGGRTQKCKEGTPGVGLSGSWGVGVGRRLGSLGWGVEVRGGRFDSLGEGYWGAEATLLSWSLLIPPRPCSVSFLDTFPFVGFASPLDLLATERDKGPWYP